MYVSFTIKKQRQEEQLVLEVFFLIRISKSYCTVTQKHWTEPELGLYGHNENLLRQPS